MRSNGQLAFVTGSSRQGKTESVKYLMRKTGMKRAIVWSVKENIDLYQKTKLGCKVYIVSNKADLLNTVKNTIGTGNGLVIYSTNDLNDFGFFCKAAFAWGKLKPCNIVCEELADVTTPQKAPDAWGQICRKGLGYGINIFAVTQRPAESEKTSIGNCTYIVCHSLKRENDRKYMANELNVNADQIRDLEQYHHIYYDFKGHKIQKFNISSR